MLRIHIVIICIVLPITLYAQFPGIKIDRPIEATPITDEEIISYISTEMKFSFSDPKRILSWVENTGRISGIENKIDKLEKLSAEELEIKETTYEIIGDTAYVQCDINNKGLFLLKEKILLKKIKNSWQITESSFLVNYLNKLKERINVGENSLKNKNRIQTPTKSGYPYKYSNSALIRRSCFIPDVFNINGSYLKENVGQNFIHHPMDSKIVRLYNGNNERVFLAVLVDVTCRRMFYAKWNEDNILDNWIKDYGNEPGEFDLTDPENVTIDCLGNIFVVSPLRDLIIHAGGKMLLIV